MTILDDPVRASAACLALETFTGNELDEYGKICNAIGAIQKALGAGEATPAILATVAAYCECRGDLAVQQGMADLDDDCTLWLAQIGRLQGGLAD